METLHENAEVTYENAEAPRENEEAPRENEEAPHENEETPHENEEAPIGKTAFSYRAARSRCNRCKHLACFTYLYSSNRFRG